MNIPDFYQQYGQYQQYAPYLDTALYIAKFTLCAGVAFAAVHIYETFENLKK